MPLSVFRFLHRLSCQIEQAPSIPVWRWQESFSVTKTSVSCSSEQYFLELCPSTPKKITCDFIIYVDVWEGWCFSLNLKWRAVDPERYSSKRPKDLCESQKLNQMNKPTKLWLFLFLSVIALTFSATCQMQQPVLMCQPHFSLMWLGLCMYVVEIINLLASQNALCVYPLILPSVIIDIKETWGWKWENRKKALAVSWGFLEWLVAFLCRITRRHLCV